jgi:ABC-2 type transport system permease protein
MFKSLRIARREYNAQVRTKGFIIGLALAPLLACGGLIAFLLLKDQVDIADKGIAVIDRSGIVAGLLVDEAQNRRANNIHDRETGEKTAPDYLIEIVEPDDEEPEMQRLALSDRVRARDLYAFVEIGPDILHPVNGRNTAFIRYHSKNPLDRDVRDWMFWPINNSLRRTRALEAGLDEELVNSVTARIGIEQLGLVSVDRDTGKVSGAKSTNELTAIFVPFGFMILLFMMIMMGAMPLLGSVLEEKTQRIAEVLLGSISPFGFMAGKLLGGVAVSLTSVTVYIVAATIVLNSMDATENVPFHILPWFLLFLIAAILMFGAILAAVGSACNEQSEAQSLMPFVMIPMLIPMFIWFAVVKEPASMFSTVMSLIPPFTPLLMTVRMATPSGVPLWQPIAGLAGVTLFTIFCIWAGGRVFRVGILVQGNPPKIGTLIRWVMRG